MRPDAAIRSYSLERTGEIVTWKRTRSANYALQALGNARTMAGCDIHSRRVRFRIARWMWMVGSMVMMMTVMSGLV